MKMLSATRIAKSICIDLLNAVRMGCLVDSEVWFAAVIAQHWLSTHDVERAHDGEHCPTNDPPRGSLGSCVSARPEWDQARARK